MYVDQAKVTFCRRMTKCNLATCPSPNKCLGTGDPVGCSPTANLDLGERIVYELFDTEPTPDPVPDGGLPWWWWIVLVAVLIIITLIIVGVIWYRRRSQKEEEASSNYYAMEAMAKQTLAE